MTDYLETSTKASRRPSAENVADPISDLVPLIARSRTAAGIRDRKPADLRVRALSGTDVGKYRIWGKRAIETAVVVASLPAILPVMALTALALAFEGNGIFYCQRRIGHNGRSFHMFKFRTMVPDADRLLQEYLSRDPELRREWDRTQKLKADPRITRLGGFLRRSSLDELPQLWHVLTGDMSLVGPRPMLPKQVEIYGDMRAYVGVRPGITGLWQVMERNESDFSSRAQADRKYARQCSLELDLKLIAKTFGVVLRGTGY